MDITGGLNVSTTSGYSVAITSTNQQVLSLSSTGVNNGPQIYFSGNNGGAYLGIDAFVNDTFSIGTTGTAPLPLGFTTNSTTRMSISAAGNVVINTPVSGDALQINTPTATSAVQFSDGTRTGQLFIGSNPGYEIQVGAYTDHGLVLFTNNTNRLQITNTGNVNVLAPTSGVALTATGVSGQNVALFTSGNSGTQGAGDVQINRNGSTANSIGTGPSLQLNDTSTNNASMFQNSGGQTEIWQSNGAWKQMAYWDTTGNLHANQNIYTGQGVVIGNGYLYTSNGTQKLIISDKNDGWLRLNQNRNFSNGTYTPGNLRVDGSVYLNANATIQQSTQTYGSVQIQGQANGSYFGYVINDGATTPTFMSNGTSVGVYRQTGGSYWSWLDNGTNFIIQNSIVCSGNIQAESDATLKKDVKTIENALEKVLDLRGVEFTMKNTGVRTIGFIAQEVKEVVPEVVSVSEKGIHAVAYGNIVGLLVEAIKDLKNEIEQLKAKVGV